MNNHLDVYFVEESCPMPDEIVDARIKQYADTIKEASAQNFNLVRYETDPQSIKLTQTVTIFDYFLNHKNDQSVKAILSMQARPYFEDDSEAEKSYVENGMYKARIGNKEIESFSLTAALLNRSIGVGFANNGFESIVKIPVTIASDSKKEEQYVICITEKNQFESTDYIDWANKNSIFPKISKSHILPYQKKIHLSDHHGTDSLLAFAKRLVQEDFIVEIINSIDRLSQEKKLIHKMHDNVIELRLLDGDGYGLAVLTTARNQRELTYIAHMLEQKYSKV